MWARPIPPAAAGDVCPTRTPGVRTLAVTSSNRRGRTRTPSGLVRTYRTSSVTPSRWIPTGGASRRRGPCPSWARGLRVVSGSLSCKERSQLFQTGLVTQKMSLSLQRDLPQRTSRYDRYSEDTYYVSFSSSVKLG